MISIAVVPPVLPRTRLVLAGLFLVTFVMGTAELVVVGVIDVVAGDLQVSVAAAGTLVTSYAVGLAVGGPLLAAVTIRIPPRTLLLTATAAYLAATVLAAALPGLAAVLVARVLLGAVHGLIVGVAFTVATSIVPAERAGRAIALVLGGIAVAAAAGVPLGTLVGQVLGWRATFLATAGLGILALGVLAGSIPPVAASAAPARAQLRHALAPRVLLVLCFGLLLFAGQYAALTYLTPFLAARSGVSGAVVGMFLLAYGVATAVGVLGGGRFADRAASRTILVGSVLLVGVLASLYVVGSVPALVVLALLAWGLIGFGLVPSVQHRVLELAGEGRALAATLPASAINIGIATGSLVGGWALTGHGASAPVLAGAGLCALAVPLAWLAGRLHEAGPVPGWPAAVGETERVGHADGRVPTAGANEPDASDSQARRAGGR